MVKLTFYGGVNEIGGNKILLEDKGTKIFLDFGQVLYSHQIIIF
jgi:ribonuclease J